MRRCRPRSLSRRVPRPRGALLMTALLALGAGMLSPPPSAAASAPATTAAATTVTAASADDYCADQCSDILPPGANGNATLAGILAHRTLGTRPKHSSDQLGPYTDLVAGYPSLTDASLAEFFNDASFGVPEDQVESVTRPREDVTITRDKKTGVPHIQGTTREGTEFGAGYAAAQDRLWLMDLFRHIGRGELTPFAGGAAGNQGLEQQFWPQAPYTEADLQAQIDRIAASGERGAQAMADSRAYLDGINAYIEKAKKGRYFPGEYVLTGHVDAITNIGTIEKFELTDMVALASVVGALFGGGGGGEVQSAIALLAAQEKYGTEKGTAVWEAFRQRNDPEAVLTLHDGESFPYAGKPENARGTALPDPGSVTAEPLVYDREGTAVKDAETPVEAPAHLRKLRNLHDDGVLPADLFAKPHGMSNALMVSGAHTASGNPVAVFGPQTGYFAPQLLMLQELQGPGISARGASFAGVGMYVQLGRGQDYAWSATSAGQDITDTYAVELCEPDGSAPTKDSSHYRNGGACEPMEKLEKRNAWKPSLADSTARGSYRMQVFRTDYGIVTHRATVDGKPVAFTSLRSTYRHEAESIIGFQMFNDPGYVTDAKSFQRAAEHVNYTFNWFYADSRDTAYFNSGSNPVRAGGVDASLPVKAEEAYEWREFDPGPNTAAYTPADEHPQSVNQDYYISWNNKQAEDYTSAGFGDGSVHRGDLLDARVKRLTERGGVTRASLTRVMAEAGVTDLRGEAVLPELLKVLRSGAVSDPAAAEAVQRLESWAAGGAQRKETKAGSRTYAHAEAIRTMDAWWPLLVEAQFAPGLGDALYDAFRAKLPLDESPSASHGATGGHAGSAFLAGWWSYVDKDLRAVLGEPVAGGLEEEFCGGGDLSACREVLLTTLTRAAATPATEVYPGDEDCEPGDQWCSDAIIHRPVGGITHPVVHWQNRPTYQQVVEFPRHR
ncbi:MULTISPECIES: penicillin acylase family protein [Streptomyces]|uniref:Penicillin acylase family protein n=2 Tax=Streptomyces TaxID=1883 RepID=A0A3R7FWL4_9ACTN|nr:penicillin acylase [Streptomyces fradiae]OFA53103.1 penicillin acylase [Streptomyces fradiae]PQM19982.1 penicillin acylase family protein [Streptomyces xinghaiensis]RKM96418.1 penicillin acylase family protein [Streptomyces xinghaiensis]RNC74431.1 penicillin acylase family protein [Streptomyces xinghaiensis]